MGKRGNNCHYWGQLSSFCLFMKAWVNLDTSSDNISPYTL